MSDALRTERLTKYYGPVVGLEDLTLAVGTGEIFGFLGPNGAGKTTAIRLLLDLVRPSRGEAWIGGHHCHRDGLAARHLVGYLPGDLPLYPELSGRAFLDYLARAGQRPIAPATIDRLLRRFDVSAVDLGRPMREYSHGMKRKLGLIQALAPDPPILILDEPTNGLDPLMIEAFAETLHEFKQQRRTTVFLSSHVLAEVERTCDRIALVRRGRLAALQSIAEIQASFPRRVTVRFAAPVNGAGPAGDLVHVVAREPQTWVLDVRGSLAPVVASLQGLPVDDLHVEPFTLEDYVLRFYADQRIEPRGGGTAR